MYYLAYGSNLHPYRLQQRVPSAHPLGVASLRGLRLEFQKRSRDGSAKCMYVESGASNDVLYTAVYRIAEKEKPTLDAIEGLGQGYDEAWHRVRLGDAALDAFAYAANPSYVEPGLRPYDWYRDMVLLGAGYHDLPTTLIDAIRSVATVPDPDPARAEKKSGLCARMRDINESRGRDLTTTVIPIL